MKLLLKLSLALLMSVSFGQVSFARDMELEDGDEYFEDGTETRGCKRVKCLVVCGSATVGGTLSVSGNESVGGNLAVGGNETVGGSITAGSFVVSPAAAVGTPAVPGIGGLLAWGEVSSTLGVAVVAGPVPMNNAGSSFSGVVEGATSVGATSGLTLTTAGVYLFQYTATQSVVAAATFNLISTLTASPIPFSQFTVTPGTAGVDEVSGFVIVSMPAGAFVQLNTTTGFTPPAGPNVGAKLIAMRIA